MSTPALRTLERGAKLIFVVDIKLTAGLSKTRR